MRGRRVEALGALALVGAMGLTGCARARAVTPAEVPLLDAPPAPPRVVPSVSVEEPAAPAAPAAPAGNTPPAAGAAAPPPRSGTRLEPPAEASPAPGPPPTLETPVSGSAAERQIRAELARAAERLREVTYASLTPDLKGQYDIAERFVRQAHEALGARNLVYAATLAEKAAEIANALPRR